MSATLSSNTVWRSAMDRCCIGIDIGSSFTKAAAVIGKGKPTPIKNIEDGTNSFRSLIYFPTDEENVIIGDTAFYENSSRTA